MARGAEHWNPHLIGGDEVLAPATGSEAKRVLVNIDRQVAEIDCRLMGEGKTMSAAPYE